MEDKRIIKGIMGIRTREGGGVDVFVDDEYLDVLLEEKFGLSWERSGCRDNNNHIFHSIVGEAIITKLGEVDTE